jgi:hypothetical protein
MTYEVLRDAHSVDEWCAEAIDFESEGECYKVIFYGPDSEARAREYAAWKNAEPAE